MKPRESLPLSPENSPLLKRLVSPVLLPQDVFNETPNPSGVEMEWQLHNAINRRVEDLQQAGKVLLHKLGQEKNSHIGLEGYDKAVAYDLDGSIITIAVKDTEHQGRPTQKQSIFLTIESPDGNVTITDIVTQEYILKGPSIFGFIKGEKPTVRDAVTPFPRYIRKTEFKKNGAVIESEVSPSLFKRFHPVSREEEEKMGLLPPYDIKMRVPYFAGKEGIPLDTEYRLYSPELQREFHTPQLHMLINGYEQCEVMPEATTHQHMEAHYVLTDEGSATINGYVVASQGRIRSMTQSDNDAIVDVSGPIRVARFFSDLPKDIENKEIAFKFAANLPPV